jgi:very-short-patch-repair endonuclease
VRRDQLLALGLARSQIDHWVRRGVLVSLFPSVYAIGHAPLTDRGLLVAAAFAVGEDATSAHRSAAAEWGLMPAPPVPELVVVRAKARGPRGLVLRTTSRLDAIDVRHVDGLRVTAPARTIVDLAATERAEVVERALVEARVRRLVRTPDIRAAAERAPGRRGRALLRDLLGGDLAAPTRSAFERRFLALVRRAGLQAPAVNARLGPFLVDALWPLERVVVETDGWAAHGHRRAFEKDRARDAHLAADGYVVVRFTWRQLTAEPELVAARLAQVLARRAA